MNTTTSAVAAGPATTLYRTIWRWHFYAGLFVVPMILVLALTGAAYLFKPQVERWEERAYQNLPTANAVSPDAQVRAALAAFPGGRLHSYRIPAQDGDAAMIHLALPDGTMRDVFVAPQGQMLGAFDPDRRIMQLVHDIHGQLLLGKRGSWLVELAASWAIVMIVTGLYLWWPRGRGAAGVVWPRLAQGRRVFWRDLHAVTGFWVAGLALVLLVTGLPWADVWGSAFKAVRSELGWVKGAQDWTIGGRAPAGDDAHAEHDHAAMLAGMNHGAADGTIPAMAGMEHVRLSRIVALARSEHLAFPVLVAPPGAPGRFGKGKGRDWVVRSDTQNRPLRMTITYDAMTGKEKRRETFADNHPIDRVVGYGVAWHEGALFGWVNQLIGVLTALMLVTLAVSGFVMWQRRRPDGRLGAPPPPSERQLGRLVPAIFVLAALLPLLALSLLTILALERLALPRLPRLAAWLGLARPA
ncbi:PepSY-associated TM helix domain-containing protein [Novosphingobium piscinae]|uniref:PepSY domain-containing protein n=1 Tax=Novosphingobium piscinae TaxID=1507448 RepID=A0A7X1FY45_9SPHN|nr:PepSY domain-containing protein [Novosphingobium piscinae]MBC2669024.1 PepSY domain-containing protein [Novosphingobium piscinae]